MNVVALQLIFDFCLKVRKIQGKPDFTGPERGVAMTILEEQGLGKHCELC